MDLPSLPRRIRLVLKGRLPRDTLLWVVRAAAGFEQQLRDARALPHRTVTEAIGRAIGIPRPKRAALGDALDLLQTAFDLADNIADSEADAMRGRTYAKHYRDIPKPALLCLPALMTSVAVQVLYETFPGPSYQARFAAHRVVRVLGEMVEGQGTPESSVRHLDLVSGKQGLLLCLPFWLVARAGSPWKTRLVSLEDWAFRFGCTWEYWLAHAESPNPQSARALARASAKARRAWPSFPPFRDGESLASDRLIPSMVC